MEGDLDWSSPELLDALNADAINGFGFQCNREQPGRKACLYIGRVFLSEPDRALDYDRWDVDTQQVLQHIRSTLNKTLASPENVWFTDWLGRDYLTVATCEYNNIATIINAVLQRYRFRTHNGNSSHTALFKQGEVFTRQHFERRLMETLEEGRAMYADIFSHTGRENTEEARWRAMYEYGGFRPFLRHYNYATEEGRALCTRIRRALRKKERTKFKPRMTWPSYAATAKKYGILHCGGWAAYAPDLGMYPASPPDVPTQEAQECMICMDAAATTTVLPCGCQVVCDACSVQLRNTADNKMCVRCRNAITHVAYEKNNELEIK